jgi:hypothetical protein
MGRLVVGIYDPLLILRRCGFTSERTGAWDEIGDASLGFWV